MSKPSAKELRELDAWISEHCFGWSFSEIKAAGPLGYPPNVARVPMYVQVVPHYTGDPAAAMQVLEKCLSSDKLTMPIEMDRKRHKAGRFRIETGAFSNSIVEIDDTLPLAICRFSKSLFEK